MANYLEHVLDYSPGDTLILYSDGVNEYSNGCEDFGYERFENCLASVSEQRPMQVVQRVLKSLSDFGSCHGVEDDVTLLVARFEEHSQDSAVSNIRLADRFGEGVA
jgi:serine phosphatase RsbU (regulator of sigma subunit)